MDPEGKHHEKLLTIAEQLGILPLLEYPLRYFSNGETRKTLIGKALLSEPKLMILDEPFDGLDKESVLWLKQTISSLINNGMPVWLVSHSFDEMVPEIKHFLCLKRGEVFVQGTRSEVLTPDMMGELYGDRNILNSQHKKAESVKKKYKKLALSNHCTTLGNNNKDSNIIRMKNVNVSYGRKVVLKNFNWSVHHGENWKIVGPNGAGKSTLLSLISGDNLQAYSNEIYLFGLRRGTGESIWDIKQKIGLVSSELQVHYLESISALKVVLSGFVDSIGYYQIASATQKKTALSWMEFLGIAKVAEDDFTRLSYGQQRLVLIARAMVKSPPLLILDEPCQGLDRSNRNHVLELIDHIGQNSATQILYVTHIIADQLNCLHSELCFDAKPDGIFLPNIS